MKIIKKGIKKGITKRFICADCCCIWEAEKGEYNVTSHLGIMYDGLKAYNMNCPCCGAFVDAD